MSNAFTFLISDIIDQFTMQRVLVFFFSYFTMCYLCPHKLGIMTGQFALGTLCSNYPPPKKNRITRGLRLPSGASRISRMQRVANCKPLKPMKLKKKRFIKVIQYSCTEVILPFTLDLAMSETLEMQR